MLLVQSNSYNGENGKNYLKNKVLRDGSFRNSFLKTESFVNVTRWICWGAYDFKRTKQNHKMQPK